MALSRSLVGGSGGASASAPAPRVSGVLGGDAPELAGWEYSGAATLVSLGPSVAAVGVAAAPGTAELAASAAASAAAAEQAAVWEQLTRQKEAKLAEFRRSVQRRVSARTRIKRKAWKEESIEAVRREVAALELSRYDDRLHAVPEVVRRADADNQRVEAADAAVPHGPGATTAPERPYSLAIRAEEVRYGSHRARRQLFSQSQAARRGRFYANAAASALSAEPGQRCDEAGLTVAATPSSSPKIAHSDGQGAGASAVLRAAGAVSSTAAVAADQTVSERAVLSMLTSSAELELERKRRAQQRFGMSRRLYMDNERDKVRVKAQQRAHLARVTRIKRAKEQQRLQAEAALQSKMSAAAGVAPQPGLAPQSQAVSLAEANSQRIEASGGLEVLRAELAEAQKRAGAQDEQESRELARFTAALRHQIQERCAANSVELPPLCSCFPSFWDHDVELCANNCSFHRNPQAHLKVLSTLLKTTLLR